MVIIVNRLKYIKLRLVTMICNVGITIANTYPILT